MIEPSMFAMIRDGETSLYSDPCGSVMFIRNLVWGPSELEQWLLGLEPVQDFDEEADSGAIIDFDAKAILWHTDEDALDHPKRCQLFDRLMTSAWDGYEVLYASDGISDLRVAVGGTRSDRESGALIDCDEEDDPLCSRYATINEALEDEDAEDWDDDDSDHDEALEDACAWITILQEDGSVHHRRLEEITLDILDNQDSPLDQLMKLKPVEVPAEVSVREAILFDCGALQLSFWGSRRTLPIERPLREHWCDWQVQRIEEGGYEYQCSKSGPLGVPYSETEALGSVIPILLYTERIDGAKLFGAIGKSIKGIAVKLVALLTIVICFPILIFTLISGNFQAGGITIGVVVAIVFTIFKLIERKWKRGFAETVKGTPMSPTTPNGDKGIAVAGPVDQQARRARLDELLSLSGMPSIREIEPHFEEDPAELFA